MGSLTSTEHHVLTRLSCFLFPFCPPAPAALCMFPAMQRQQSVQPERHKVVVSTDGLMPSTSASYADEEGHKYARRAHPLRRTLQRLFPNMFAPGLPVTNRLVIVETVHTDSDGYMSLLAQGTAIHHCAVPCYAAR
jgi:hypothetical protein